MGGFLHGKFLADPEAAGHPNAPEKGGLAPELLPLFLAEPEVDLFQVVGAVVAGDALQVDPQEVPGAADGDVLDAVLVVDGQPVGVVGVVPGQIVGGGRLPVGAGRGRQHLGDQLVVGHVQQQRRVEIVPEEIPSLGADLALGGAKEIAQVIGPAIQIGVGGVVGGGGVHPGAGQLVDEPGPLVGVGVLQEAPNLVDLRQAAGQVQVGSAQEFGVRRQGSVRNPVLLQLVEDEVVDVVVSADRRRVLRTGQAGCHPAGDLIQLRPAAGTGLGRMRLLAGLVLRLAEDHQGGNEQRQQQW